MSEQPTLVKFGGQPCVIMDPAKYPQARGKANGYCCPLGKSPGIGYVLMLRSAWDNIERRRNSPQTLEVLARQRITLPAMYIISAVKISGGRPNDPNSVYMVKFTDRRWIAAKLSDVTKQINVRCPAPPETAAIATKYYEDSLNAGAAYSWTAAVQAIWESMPILGAFGSLPYTPHSVPENYQFLGVNAWDALHVLLDRLQCAVAYDPVADTFAIVKLGSTQADLADLFANGDPYLDDAEPFDTTVEDSPATIRVYFSRADLQYGSGFETKAAAGTWATSLLTAVDTASGITGAAPGTVLALWDDLAATADFVGAISNQAALDTRAAERVANWKADRATSSPRLRTVYQGIVRGFRPGSQLKYVWWRNTGEGWVTEIARHAGMMKLVDDAGGLRTEAADTLGTPDVVRRRHPNYPQYLQLVTVDSESGGDPAGTVVPPTSDGLFPGVVTRMDPDAATDTAGCFGTAESCWLLVVNRLTGSASTAPTLIKGERYLGRLCGSKLLGADPRPVYLIHKDDASQLIYFELTTALVYGTAPGADNAKVLEWDAGTSEYTATGATIRVYDAGIVPTTFGNWVGRGPVGGFVGYQGYAILGTSGRYEIVWMEEQAKWLKFKLGSQLKYNVASIGCSEVESWDGREIPSGTITLYNSETDTAGVYLFWGPADAIGYAVYDDKAGKYKIVSLETHAKYIEFTLASASAGTAAFTAGTAAGATVNSWWDGRKWWGGTTRDIQDPQGLFVRALQGAKGIARWNEQYDSGNGGYEAIECQSKAGWIDFTLTAAMSAGSSSAATVNDYGGAGQDVQNPGSAIAVYDEQDLWKYAPIGAKGRAIYDAVDDKYKIVECQNKARYIKFTIAGSTLATTDASKSGCTVDDYWQGVSPGSTVTIYNQEKSSNYLFEGVVGHKGIAVWDDIEDKYRIIQMECP